MGYLGHWLKLLGTEEPCTDIRAISLNFFYEKKWLYLNSYIYPFPLTKMFRLVKCFIPFVTIDISSICLEDGIRLKKVAFLTPILFFRCSRVIARLRSNMYECFKIFSPFSLSMFQEMPDFPGSPLIPVEVLHPVIYTCTAVLLLCLFTIIITYILHHRYLSHFVKMWQFWDWIHTIHCQMYVNTPKN